MEMKQADGEEGACWVRNETDGVFAALTVFRSRAEARRFIEEFRARYRRQGFYRTARGERCPPEDVELRIVAADAEDDAWPR